MESLAGVDGHSPPGATFTFAGCRSVRLLDTLHNPGLRMGLDPTVGQKGFQFGRRGSADPAKDVRQVRLHVDRVPLAGHRQRVEDGRRLAGLSLRKTAKPSSHHRTFDYGLGSIVVDRNRTVFQKTLERFPPITQVIHAARSCDLGNSTRSRSSSQAECR